MADWRITFVKAVLGVGYFFAIILSLMICIPMSFHQDQFAGRCLLFSTGTWDHHGHLIANWASQAYCNFTIFVAVIMFVISIVQFWRWAKFFVRGRDSTFFTQFLDVLVAVVMVLFVIITAIFVTAGFGTWCGPMIDRFGKCSDGAGSPIEPVNQIDSNGFFIQMTIVMLGVWLSFAIWVSLATFSVVNMIRFHKQENLRAAQAKEQERLFNNEDLISEVPVNDSHQDEEGNNSYTNNSTLEHNADFNEADAFVHHHNRINSSGHRQPQPQPEPEPDHEEEAQGAAAANATFSDDGDNSSESSASENSYHTNDHELSKPDLLQ